jgi:ABC-type phosphate transport system permease subunit
MALDSTELVLSGLPKILLGFIGSLVLVPIMGPELESGFEFRFMTTMGLLRLGPTIVIGFI